MQIVLHSFVLHFRQYFATCRTFEQITHMATATNPQKVLLTNWTITVKQSTLENLCMNREYPGPKKGFYTWDRKPWCWTHMTRCSAYLAWYSGATRTCQTPHALLPRSKQSAPLPPWGQYKGSQTVVFTRCRCNYTSIVEEVGVHDGLPRISACTLDVSLCCVWTRPLLTRTQASVFRGLGVMAKESKIRGTTPFPPALLARLSTYIRPYDHTSIHPYIHIHKPGTP